MSGKKDDGPGFEIDVDDMNPDNGLSAEEREKNLERSAQLGEIDIEASAPEDEEEGKEVEPEPVQPEPKNEPDEQSGDVFEIEGEKVPAKVVEAIASALKAQASEKEPEPTPKNEPSKDDKFNEALEAAKKSAMGDKAMLDMIDLLGGLRTEIVTREQAEKQAREQAERRKADEKRLAEDFAEVEAEFGVKLSDKEKRALIATVTKIKLNPLRDAYVKLRGVKPSEGKETKKLDAMDSRKNPPSSMPDDFDLSNADKWARGLGLSKEQKKRALDRLR